MHIALTIQFRIPFHNTQHVLLCVASLLDLIGGGKTIPDSGHITMQHRPGGKGRIDKYYMRRKAKPGPPVFSPLYPMYVKPVVREKSGKVNMTVAAPMVALTAAEAAAAAPIASSTAVHTAVCVGAAAAEAAPAEAAPAEAAPAEAAAAVGTEVTVAEAAAPMASSTAVCTAAVSAAGSKGDTLLLLDQNINSITKLGFNSYRMRHKTGGWKADLTAAGGSTKLWHGEAAYEESWSLPKNWITLDTATSKQQLLPPYEFVVALGLVPKIKVSLPAAVVCACIGNKRACSAAVHVRSFNDKFGGAAYNTTRLTLGNLLEHIMQECSNLDFNGSCVAGDPEMLAEQQKTMACSKQGIGLPSPYQSAYRFFCRDYQAAAAAEIPPRAAGQKIVNKAWALFKEENGGSGGIFEEDAGVDHIRSVHAMRKWKEQYHKTEGAVDAVAPQPTAHPGGQVTAAHLTAATAAQLTVTQLAITQPTTQPMTQPTVAQPTAAQPNTGAPSWRSVAETEPLMKLHGHKLQVSEAAFKTIHTETTLTSIALFKAATLADIQTAALCTCKVDASSSTKASAKTRFEALWRKLNQTL